MVEVDVVGCAAVGWGGCGWGGGDELVVEEKVGEGEGEGEGEVVSFFGYRGGGVFNETGFYLYLYSCFFSSISGWISYYRIGQQQQATLEYLEISL